MIVVFAGPTIGAAAVTDAVSDARGEGPIVLGPARQGDVMRAWRDGAKVIAIIDGYFQSVPAVWHKEILWALANGCHVVGGASMGALRAAELHTFGMIGVGTIFEWFRDGVVIRDDEVAVAHASAEHGYRALSEALVNIRATLTAAQQASVLDAEDAARVLADAAGQFYPDRSWPALCDLLAARSPQAATRLDAFIRNGGRVDQKYADALALLEHVDANVERWTTPPDVGFTLSHTIWFDRLYAGSGRFTALDGSGDPMSSSRMSSSRMSSSRMSSSRMSSIDIDDELRLARHYRPALRSALVRWLTSEEVQRRRLTVSPEQVANYANAVCHDLGLSDQATFDAWLARNGLDLESFNNLMEREAQRNIVLSEIASPASGGIPDAVRLAGLWPSVAERAARKAELLDGAGLADPSLADTGLATHDELVSWWLGLVGHRPLGMTETTDIDALARLADFADSGSFIQALAREYCANQLGLAPLDTETNRW